MSGVRPLLTAYVAALIAFLLVDALWIMLLADDLIEREIGHLLREAPRLDIALLFYAAHIAGTIYFAVRPALVRRSLARAVVDGALLGALTFAAYGLTNLAVVQGWSSMLAVIDIGWGALVTALAAATGYLAAAYCGSAQQS